MSPPTNSAQRPTQSRRYALLRQTASVNARVGRNVSGSASSCRIRSAILCRMTRGCETESAGRRSTASRPWRPRQLPNKRFPGATSNQSHCASCGCSTTRVPSTTCAALPQTGSRSWEATARARAASSSTTNRGCASSGRTGTRSCGAGEHSTSVPGVHDFSGRPFVAAVQKHELLHLLLLSVVRAPPFCRALSLLPTTSF